MDDRDFDVLTRRVFAFTSRRSVLTSLAGLLAVLTGLVRPTVSVPNAAAQPKPKICRPLGHLCFLDRGVGCCGNVTCRQGRCRCGRNQRACGGRCINKQRCCRHRDCSGGQRCQNGRCRCPGPQTRCGKRCVNLRNAKQHCGACGNACAGTATCHNGACVAGGRYREVRRWSAEGLTNPFGVTVGGDGFLYVTNDQPGGNIWKFTTNGKLVKTWSVGGDYPAGIAVSPGGVIYVAVYGQRLIKTYLPNGKPGLSFDTGDRPLGVAVGPNGTVYVATIVSEVMGATEAVMDPIFGEGQVQSYSASGVMNPAWGSGVTDAMPAGVAVGLNGDVLATIKTLLQLLKLSAANGAVQDEWGGPGSGNGQFNAPSGVATDASGAMYVADSGNNRVQKFTVNGEFIAEIIGTIIALQSPMDVAVAPDGTLFITDSASGGIVQMIPA